MPSLVVIWTHRFRITYFLAYEYELRLFESKAQYHLRMLKFHGHETKDVSKQVSHGHALIAIGDEAIPLLLDEVQFFRFDGRYQPSPFRMLREIGQNARLEAARRIEGLSAHSHDHSVVEQRLALTTLLIISFHDLSRFEQWLQDAQDPTLDVGSYSVSQLIFAVSEHFESVSGAPPLIGDRQLINPAFLKWWRSSAT